MSLNQSDLHRLSISLDDSILLEVQYSQKDIVKSLGAKWDVNLKKWYIPAGFNLVPFYHWIPDDIYLQILPKLKQAYGASFHMSSPPKSVNNIRDYLSDSVWIPPDGFETNERLDDLITVSESASSDALIADPISNIETFWNYARNNDVDRKEWDSIIGKWMIFVDFSEIKPLWSAIVHEIRQGSWSGHAKCSTLLSNRHYFKNPERSIIVYASAENKQQTELDLRRIIKKPNLKLIWKSSADTKAGRYAL